MQPTASRLLPRALARRAALAGVFTVAALASVATSPLQWNLYADAELVEVPLVEGGALEYLIEVDLTGPVRGPSGYLDVSLIPRLAPGATATVEVSLQRLDGEQPDTTETFTLAGPEPVSMYLNAEAWSDCDRGPCSATFQLRIERLDVSADGAEPQPAVILSGGVHISAYKYEEEAPPDGTELTIELLRVQP